MFYIEVPTFFEFHISEKCFNEQNIFLIKGKKKIDQPPKLILFIYFFKIFVDLEKKTNLECNFKWLIQKKIWKDQ